MVSCLLLVMARMEPATVRRRWAPGYFGQGSHVAALLSTASAQKSLLIHPGAERDYSARLYCHLLGQDSVLLSRASRRGRGGDIAPLHLCSLIEKSRHKTVTVVGSRSLGRRRRRLATRANSPRWPKETREEDRGARARSSARAPSDGRGSGERKKGRGKLKWTQSVRFCRALTHWLISSLTLHFEVRWRRLRTGNTEMVEDALGRCISKRHIL